MRHILFAAAAFAASAFLATAAANAQVAHQAGGPDRIGNMCKVTTDGNTDMDGYGYYEPCGNQASAQAPAPRRAAPARADYEAGGPQRSGSTCKVTTDGNTDVDAYGYYEQCK